MKRLALFDIDCTLVDPHGAGGRAIAQALLDVYGVAGSLDGYTFHGRTDPQIVRDLAGMWGAPEDSIEARLQPCLGRYVELLRSEVATHGVEVLSGVRELVGALGDDSAVTLGLLTGNVAEGAAIKLAPTGFGDRFAVAAYGSDSAHRPDLPAVAVARAAEFTGHRFVGKEIAILGDSPADITCGAHLGVKAIAVATGKHTRDELAAHTPDYLFDDLSDWRAAVAAVLA